MGETNNDTNQLLNFTKSLPVNTKEIISIGSQTEQLVNNDDIITFDIEYYNKFNDHKPFVKEGNGIRILLDGVYRISAGIYYGNVRKRTFCGIVLINNNIQITKARTPVLTLNLDLVDCPISYTTPLNVNDYIQVKALINRINVSVIGDFPRDRYLDIVKVA